MEFEHYQHQLSLWCWLMYRPVEEPWYVDLQRLLNRTGCQHYHPRRDRQFLCSLMERQCRQYENNHPSCRDVSLCLSLLFSCRQSLLCVLVLELEEQAVISRMQNILDYRVTGRVSQLLKDFDQAFSCERMPSRVDYTPTLTLRTLVVREGSTDLFLDKVSQLRPHAPQIAIEAIKRGHLELLQVAALHHPDLQSDLNILLVHGAYWGQPAAMDWCLRQDWGPHTPNLNQAMLEAARGGQLNSIMYLWGHVRGLQGVAITLGWCLQLARKQGWVEAEKLLQELI